MVKILGTGNLVRLRGNVHDQLEALPCMSHTIGFLYCHVATLFRVAVQDAAMTPLISPKPICQTALLLMTVASVCNWGCYPTGQPAGAWHG